MSTQTINRRVTLTELSRMKSADEPIAMLTAYDATFARRVDAAGVDCILVGDSLGNVVQGQNTTLPVTIENMVYHTQAVSRGVEHAFLIADMPFMSYRDCVTAANSAQRLMAEGGAEMVKLEGGQSVLPQVRFLTDQGVPVCGHLGLTPQHVHRLGGYRVQGREQRVREQIIQDASDLQKAGAQMLVLECVPTALAAEITKALNIPVIGIGAGVEVDGQVLVLYDMLGLTVGHVPKFSHNFMTDGKDLTAALDAYVSAVRGRTFPSEQHSFT